MITALTLLAAAQTITLNPTDDVWVYKFAADQTSDPFLRCWGTDSKSVADPDAGEAGSWSVMKFDISKLPTTKLTSATLDLYFVPNPNIDEALGKKYPIEVRTVSSKFEEENFSLDQAASIKPTLDSLIATNPVTLYSNAEGPSKVTINLLAKQGSFEKILAEAQKSQSKELAFALTSALTPDEAGESLIYKFYSTNSEKSTRPTLTLNFE